MRHRFQSLLTEARALPGGTREIDRANAELVRGLTLAVEAYDEYLAGLTSGQFDRMEVGDAKWARASLQFAQVRPTLDKVIGKPPQGTFQQELRELSTAMQPIVGIEADRALRANTDMIDALEHGQWAKAGRKSAKAGRRFRAIVQRLERLPEPQNERLEGFLDDTLRGYGLMADAFADYDRGIAARDTRVLAVGDRKFQRGFILTQRAIAALIEASR